MRFFEDKENLSLPETQILLDLIECMPFLIEIADNNFDPKISNEILQREAEKIRVEIRMRELVS